MTEHSRSDTEWFREAKWGVFIHFLASDSLSSKEWNERVEAFDVDRLSDQLQQVGAGYLFLTLGQNSGHYCSPNDEYDSIVGTSPSKLSERDLVSDLHRSLLRKGLRLLLYLPSGAPAADKIATKRLAWAWGYKGKWPNGREPTGQRLAGFQEMWERVISEWSLRWGQKVSGWWIDGCYFADAMYRHPDPPNFSSFRSALLTGNPSGIVAFNPGVKVPVISLTEFEDYTAGEISDAFPVCPGRWVDGAQYHILSYLGERWGSGLPRFPDDFPVGYTTHVNERGGVVTWEVPILDDGSVPKPFLSQLAAIGRRVAES